MTPRSIITGAGLAAAAALALAGSAVAAPSTAPANGGFAVDSAGWSSAGSCNNPLGVLCTVTNRYRSDVGAPPGSMDAVFTNQVNAIGDGSSLLASPSFAWRGGAATSLAFAYDRRGDVAQLVRLGGEVNAMVDLVDTTSGARTRIVQPQPVVQSAGFATTSAPVPPGVLVEDHSYRLELTTIFRNLVAAQTAATVGYDNVRLTADGAGAFDLGDLSGGGTLAAGAGAGGLGACAAPTVTPPKGPSKGSPSGKVTVSAKQLRDNQRISQDALRRANLLADRLAAGLTGADFRGCALGMKEFSSAAVTGAQNGGVAIPAAGAVAAARATPTRRRATPKKVTLSAGQLLINQRIAQAAVLRVNAMSKRMQGGLTAGDLRNGTLAAFDSRHEPAAGLRPRRARGRRLDEVRAAAPRAQGHPARAGHAHRQAAAHQPAHLRCGAATDHPRPGRAQGRPDRRQHQGRLAGAGVLAPPVQTGTQ